MKKGIFLLAFLACASLYFMAGHRPEPSDCVRSTSPDARYVAEECLLEWNHGDNPKYSGKLYDAKTGTLLAQRILHTSVPQIMWGQDAMLFERGGEDENLVRLPPSFFERFSAVLHQSVR
ncbi:hypothetical protein G3N59_24620 [Paraburkholderia sp. Ac-20340]|uniref:hypothetical protein n=1 Tax=Paraburkholderia sp. Ac-20340 TaxID=2703888 RepID=UPI00197EBF45|nr:hypothetical protein [Paraburkholderia sp. Ac-20340]MBN3856570.1 hypothetical protein [Paraburkholderia sp. Ac-20340]